MKPGVILSMEQALSMTYATLRFAQLGWRVIKLEATAPRPDALPGDPNRYIGTKLADEGRRSYFVAPNVGKESIALNLKSEAGQAALKRIITELKVDVFCCNTVPLRYTSLGIDYESLRAVKPDLIWAAISAAGPDFPDVAGYDPVIQATAGIMDITGAADGPPTLAGVPLVDLKAGDEVYANVWMALAERATTGLGKRIDVSMTQAIASWLITVLPLVDMGGEAWEWARCGNEHRKFVPTNAYPTADGVILMAMGSDPMWRRFVGLARFASLDKPERRVNEGRLKERDALHREITAITSQHQTAVIAEDLKAAMIPHAPIRSVPEVLNLPAIADKVTRTCLPNGQEIRMQPMAVDVADARTNLSFPPRYGEQTRDILAEVGYDAREIDAMLADGSAADPRAVERAAGAGNGNS